MGTERLGEIVAKRYRLVDVLGTGGMATVYCSVDLVRLMPVAVKLMHCDRLERAVAVTRFHREARAIAKLDDARFAQLLDWGIEDGHPFMVMELVRGENLHNLLRRHRALSVITAVRIGIAICDLLEVAHERGLVHRDIKPRNVMMESVNDPASIKLIDFGIAKELSASFSDDSMVQTNHLELTQEGTLMGTPPYTPPEQLRGRKIDRRADIYSLGVLMFRMLAGRPPFEGNHAMATACKQLSRPPPPVRSIRKDIDPSLEAILLRCMSPEPEARFGTASALRTALIEVLACSESAPPTQRSATDHRNWATRAVAYSAVVLAAAAMMALFV